MRVLYPDGETRLISSEFALPLTLVIESLLRDGGLRLKEVAANGFVVKGYWIMPADGRGSPVMRIDCKMVGMIAEGPVGVERAGEQDERDELENGIRSQGF